MSKFLLSLQMRRRAAGAPQHLACVGTSRQPRVSLLVTGALIKRQDPPPDAAANWPFRRRFGFGQRLSKAQRLPPRAACDLLARGRPDVALCHELPRQKVPRSPITITLHGTSVHHQGPAPLVFRHRPCAAELRQPNPAALAVPAPSPSYVAAGQRPRQAQAHKQPQNDQHHDGALLADTTTPSSDRQAALPRHSHAEHAQRRIKSHGFGGKLTVPKGPPLSSCCLACTALSMTERYCCSISAAVRYGCSLTVAASEEKDRIGIRFGLSLAHHTAN